MTHPHPPHLQQGQACKACCTVNNIHHHHLSTAHRFALWMHVQAEKHLAERGGVSEGHFLVRATSEGHVLSVIYKGKPTHHKVEPDPSKPGVLLVNGKDYGALASIEDVVKKFSAACPGWCVVTLKPV
jgi:hypothetical protein